MQLNLLEQFEIQSPQIIEFRYLNDDPSQGIDYDWDRIFAEYYALGIPKAFYSVSKSQFLSARYHIGLSTRKIGKTTAWLLLGMTMNRYGCEIQYMRRTEDELAPSFAMELVATIRNYDGGKYIKQLTDGKYNDIYYHWRGFYYCTRDAFSGEITAKASRPFMKCLSIDRWQDYKSSYNAPTGDLILLDEFIAKGVHYSSDEFIGFMNNLDTIIRHRNNAHIAMLANVIAKTNMYFDELGIGRLVKKMSTGETHLFQSLKGTKAVVAFLDAPIIHSKRNQLHNELYFGWDNPAMVSITGEGNWSIDVAPHIDESVEDREVIWNNIVIEFALMEYLRLKYVYDVEGYHIEVTPCTHTHKDDTILGLDRVRHSFYGFGSEPFEKLLRTYLIANRIRYGTNELQDIFKDYMVRAAMDKRLI